MVNKITLASQDCVVSLYFVEGQSKVVICVIMINMQEIS